jgi:hypothetical protein
MVIFNFYCRCREVVNLFLFMLSPYVIGVHVKLHRKDHRVKRLRNPVTRALNIRWIFCCMGINPISMLLRHSVSPTRARTHTVPNVQRLYFRILFPKSFPIQNVICTINVLWIFPYIVSVRMREQLWTYKYYVSVHYPSSSICLKYRTVYFSKHDVSDTGFCLRLQVKPTQLGQINRSSPYLRTPVSLPRWGI